MTAPWELMMDHLAATRDEATFNEVETRSFPGRTFRMWDYLVGHQQLVIRSPGTEPGQPHIDLYFRGVDYLRCPSSFIGVSIVKPTTEELRSVEGVLGPRRFEPSWVHVLESQGSRHLIVAALLKVGETDYPLMATPLVHPS